MFKPTLVEVLKDEKTYRAHPAWNYSKIKWWLTKSPLSWRKKFILGLNEDDPDNVGIKNGSLVDVKLLGKEDEFEEKYFIAQVDKLPTPQNLRFCEKLMELTLLHTDEEGTFIGDFAECFERAYEAAEISTPKLPKFTENFEGSDTEAYYRQLRESSGKTVITFNEVEQSDGTVNTLRNDENTRDIFSGDGENQLPLVFEYEGFEFKILIDRVKLDHKNKIISVFDLKTTYAPQDFGYQYLKLRYDIQDAIYSKGCEAYRDAKYPDYTLEKFKFVVVDMPTFHRPLVWSFEFDKPQENPWFGFTHRGKPYKGIWKALEEIAWHMERDEWRIKKEHFDNQGNITFKIGD